MKSDKVIFYGFQFAHHGDYSAFNALKRKLKKSGIKVVTAQRPKVFFQRGFRRFLPVWMQIQELKLYKYFKDESVGIVHYFFPENSIYNGPKWRKDTKIILTCHQPVKRNYFKLQEKIKPEFIRGIKNADAIILMSSNDIEAYKRFAPQADVLYIPHGIDIEFFKRVKSDGNPEQKDGCKHVLTVGSWLRDYDFWAEVVKNILKHSERNYKFTIVAGDEIQKKIADKFDNNIPHEIEMLTKISDQKLRATYASSDLMFLPLIDSWANNALLEAAAMELPIMVTDLPSIREYFTNDLPFYFYNKSAEKVSHKLIEILGNNYMLNEKGKALRSYVEKNYSWEKIVDKHIEKYFQYMSK